MVITNPSYLIRYGGNCDELKRMSSFNAKLNAKKLWEDWLKGMVYIRVDYRSIFFTFFVEKTIWNFLFFYWLRKLSFSHQDLIWNSFLKSRIWMLTFNGCDHFERFNFFFRANQRMTLIAIFLKKLCNFWSILSYLVNVSWYFTSLNDQKCSFYNNNSIA